MKPILEILYMSEKKKLADVALQMKTQHGFDRLEHQYQCQFREWKWSRKAGKDVMPRILEHVKYRSGAGKSSEITLDGRVVERKKIRRALKDEKRAIMDSIALKSSRSQTSIVEGPMLPYTNSFLLKWNLPYAAMRHSQLSDWLYQYWFFYFKTAKHWGKGPII
ncbi:hypothetical protein N0V90_001710 [Kalmusia sp. IMI 367209]|nr:hypothetical protein N0V90_001710 [Kalmusia sp. IMI 367209]